MKWMQFGDVYVYCNVTFFLKEPWTDLLNDCIFEPGMVKIYM